MDFKCCNCSKMTPDPWIKYNCKKENDIKYICSYICSRKVGSVGLENIINIEDFNEPRPVIPIKFSILSDNQINRLPKYKQDKYYRELYKAYLNNPIEYELQYSIINSVSDSESDYEDDSNSDDFEYSDEY